MKAYYYMQGTCKSKKSPYNGLYPVEVERGSGFDPWEIRQMACSMRGTEGCVPETCEIWQKAERLGTVPKEEEVKVRAEKL